MIIDINVELNNFIRYPKLNIRCHVCKNDMDNIIILDNVNYHFYDCCICKERYYVGYNIRDGGKVNYMEILYMAEDLYKDILIRRIYEW